MVLTSSPKTQLRVNLLLRQMLDIDLVDRAGGGVSHVAENGEDDTGAEDATVSKLLTDM